MNFLAHLYLSPDDDDIRVGNFIADTVKGSCWRNYPVGIQKGIFLHRAIDDYTDKHEEVRKCTKKMQPFFRLYSSVVVDIYFDHFLAVNWKLYSAENLSDYVSKQYGIIRKYQNVIPPKAKVLFQHLERGNWLENYQSISFLKQVFKGMAKRTSFVSNMETAPEKLVEDYEFYQQAFLSFFPQICEEVKNFEAIRF